jgi:hypothetical protein
VRRLTSLVLLAAVPLWAGCGGGDPAETARDDKVIGIVRAVRSTEGEVNQAAFLAELASLGYTEGRNLTVHGRDVDEVHAEAVHGEVAALGVAQRRRRGPRRAGGGRGRGPPVGGGPA